METHKSKYAINDEVYVFMTYDAFTEETKIIPKKLMFMALGKVIEIPSKEVEEQYLIKLEHIYLDRTPSAIVEPLFNEGKVQPFHWLWVERGEEAFKIFDNPSMRWKKHGKIRKRNIFSSK